ncbi:serine hydrolase domain-containing protein [Aliikangiella maris]|uniref:Serine hydrolase domain-containing protein n=2 Tax=Aliikangiella maris TaxID=3162458 RepID=A0ABV3MU69_9GAMM
MANESQILHNYLKKAVTDTGAPSLSAAVAIEDKIIASAAFGDANKDKVIKATTATQYRTGSVAKVITATAFMSLIEQNKVLLSDDIREYLPYFPKKKWKISIENLLTHTAGIRGYNWGEYGSDIHYNSLAESSLVFSGEPLLFKPGSQYLYTTYGFNLIQGVIEKVTGSTPTEFLSEVLFQPAGMIQTELEFHYRNYPNLAIGYRSFLKSVPVQKIDVSNKFLGGGMLSTPTDLVKMVIALNQGRLLKTTTKELMWSVPFPKIADFQAYGWEWIERKNIRGVTMDGQINGFESLILYIPQHKMTVAMMVNQDNYDYTGRTGFGIAELFINQFGSNQATK